MLRSSFFSGTSGPVFDRGQFIGNQQIHLIFNHPSREFFFFFLFSFFFFLLLLVRIHFDITPIRVRRRRAARNTTTSTFRILLGWRLNIPKYLSHDAESQAQENQESPDLNVSRRKFFCCRSRLQTISHCRLGPSPPSRILRVLGLGRFIRRRISQNRILRGNNSPLERDVFEVYKQHLLPKGLGHPLWIPQSNMRLPVPYRQTGVSIGDVGIITREGAFDFLFNICYPRDHPFNSRVPPDFEPFSPSISLDSNILEYREFSCNTFLTSDDIEADPTHPK